MGALVKLIDGILFLFFLITAVATLTMDAQICLPLNLFPDSLIEAKSTYIREYSDYLMDKPPHFYIGLIWLQLLLVTPLCLANLYGIVARKGWFNTTSLICGVSFFTIKVCLVSELVGSGKASEKLVWRFITFTGLGALAILRGLLPVSGTVSKEAALSRKKRA
ncbi:Transmembrane protein 97-like [Quillaja saponaria]|uniref:Transmembrane protein 97-like n=1 Tax=Quillaja saponaria TaxID=32244 RepID=A0AAD7QH04_QUISA|nr:Transmembrane protein 97-like [Quillaja saponaria]